MTDSFNSLRMHASRSGEHICGAERLVGDAEVEAVGQALLHRALSHPRGQAGRVSLCVEQVAVDQIRRARLLALKTHQVASWPQGREVAARLLEGHGLSPDITTQAIAFLAHGAAAPGQVMRGAMLLDAATGARLEPDCSRGVRVSRMDLDTRLRPLLEDHLKDAGLSHPRIIEALILASKVTLYPEVIAELCWSDDPDYLAGYVASAEQGYQRITHLKAPGDRLGGRVLFLRSTHNIEDLMRRLQREPVLFDALRAGEKHETA